MTMTKPLASQVEYDGGTAQDVLDSAKPMASYTALRNYTGRATSVRITNTDVAGFFYRDATDGVSADNGGTIIVDASGRRWKRHYVGAASVKWFGARGDDATDDTAALQAAINSGGLPLMIPGAVYRCNNLVQSANFQRFYSEGFAVFRKNANGPT